MMSGQVLYLTAPIVQILLHSYKHSHALAISEFLSATDAVSIRPSGKMKKKMVIASSPLLTLHPCLFKFISQAIASSYGHVFITRLIFSLLDFYRMKQ